jgi:hypothetical protein
VWLLGDDHPQTLTTAATLATTVWSLGDRLAARELLEDVPARSQRVLGGDHPFTEAVRAGVDAMDRAEEVD